MLKPEWNYDFTMAVEIYSKAVQLSGCDFNGMPQLTKLEFVLDMVDCEIDDKERFMTYLTEIHFGTISAIPRK